jgi:predicted DCC family thiol-disulfide oxidoreductase YuxK
MEDKAVILFDGICNFCNAGVNFVIRRDKKDYFRFAPLQSEIGEKWTGDQRNVNMDTMFLIEDGKMYSKSDAALRVLRRLGSGWQLLYGLIIIPRFIRNFFYDLIARNRYRIFGKSNTCMMPEPGMERKFLG